MKSRFALPVFVIVALHASAQPLEQQTHKAVGIVRSIDRSAGQVVVTHEPIATLKWPTMTMTFAVRDRSMLEKLSPPKRVEFEFVLQDQQFVITSIK